MKKPMVSLMVKARSRLPFKKSFIKCPILALAALSFAACQSVDEPKVFDNEVRITTSVNNLVASRTAEAYSGSDLGLYMSPSAADSDYTYTNVKFVNNNSTWSTADNSRLLWKDQTSSHTYSAYAPHVDNLTEDCLSYDLSSNNFDLLWAGGETSHSGTTNGALAITFNHMFCQFAVEVTIGTSVGINSIGTDDSITFTNEFGAGKFNVKSGEFSDQKSCTITASKGKFTAASGNNDAVYLTPGDYFAAGTQAVTVTFNLNEKKYTYNLSERKFEAGMKYTLKLKLGSSTVQLQGVTVSAWTNNTAGDISTH